MGMSNLKQGASPWEKKSSEPPTKKSKTLVPLRITYGTSLYGFVVEHLKIKVITQHYRIKYIVRLDHGSPEGEDIVELDRGKEEHSPNFFCE